MVKSEQYRVPESKILQFATKQAREVIEEEGDELNLTALEEECQVQFGIDETEWEERDLSYAMFEQLVEEGLIDSE